VQGCFNQSYEGSIDHFQEFIFQVKSYAIFMHVILLVSFLNVPQFIRVPQFIPTPVYSPPFYSRLRIADRSITLHAPVLWNDFPKEFWQHHTQFCLIVLFLHVYCSSATCLSHSSHTILSDCSCEEIVKFNSVNFKKSVIRVSWGVGVISWVTWHLN